MNSIQNRTLSAFVTDSTSNLSVNPQFSYVGTWLYAAAIRRSTVTYPHQHTLTAGDSMTFTISQASAIFVYSEVNDDHGQFIVTFTPPPELGQPVTTIYDGNAHWLSLDRVLFWAAGMDRDKSYKVEITNIATAGTPYFDFSHVDILDATSVGPIISSTSLSQHTSIVWYLLIFFRTATDASKVKYSTPIGAIVGGTVCLFLVHMQCHLNYMHKLIQIGGLIIIVILIISFLVYRQRKRYIRYYYFFLIHVTRIMKDLGTGVGATTVPGCQTQAPPNQHPQACPNWAID